MTENTDIIDKLIVGRVRPYIYAFSTNTVPNYLKVGDTYRALGRRLQEWRRHYPDLRQHFKESAMVSEEVYFRDHSVHRFLEHDRGRARLRPADLVADEYYSNEFFQETSPEDVASAIEDIQRDYDENDGRYTYFDAGSHLPESFHYERGPELKLRPNQQAAVENFITAVDAGRTNLLMYAVMRFGKTFTALMCGKRISAEMVLVVSAKADVQGEWKRAVESAGNFDGYVFLNAEDLLGGADAIADSRADNACVVVFLTLQDLQGEDLKEKHKEIFSNDIDLLIIDETHFGARAEKYGMVLREAKQPADKEASIAREVDDRIELEDAEEQLKVLEAKVRLHLSGSPYRILMGSEFAPEDIIAFVQFSDIVREQEAWDLEHPDDNEWDNPYFGFPQMIRFAFNPNQSSRERLETLKKSGVTYAFSALLKPRKLTRDTEGQLHKTFEHEAEILDLLRVIDGSKEDENLLGFLDYKKIKEGEMCRHLVMVLPYRASCDAMQALIERKIDGFKNLGSYEIINISGVDGTRRFSTPERVKATIAQADAAGQKTLTLTVNRLLTGTTIEQWDTMLFLKDTASPQEYDQAIFRLQSQHVRVLRSETSSEVIEENLKPQTLLVDFYPMRLFQMQEQRSLMSNVNTDKSGNAHLGERLKEELRISPVITMNANRLSEVSAANILGAVSQYNLSRSIADEAKDVPVDLGLLDVAAIRRVIERQAELGSRAGLSVRAVEGDEIDLDVEPSDEGSSGEDLESPTGGSSSDPVDSQSLQRKLQTYYQRILFFAMLTPDPVASLQEAIGVIDKGDNARIANNLDLDRGVLEAMFTAFDPFKLNSLDYKVQNISRLAREESLGPIERANGAMGKFTRLSDSEVRTPLWLCKEVVSQIPAEALHTLIDRGEAILDVASKSGEFAIALYQRLVDDLDTAPEVARTVIYSIPTSGIAYEFTRLFYEILGLDVKNIARSSTAQDLAYLQPSEAVEASRGLGEVFKKGSKAVEFGAVVGNPPYQVSDGGARASARPIYPQIIAASAALKPGFMSFIIPSRWYAGGKQLGDFRAWMLSDPHISELHDFPRPEAVFPETNNRGGVCYFLRDTDYDAGKAGGTRVYTHDAQHVEFEVTRPLNSFDMGMFIRDSRGIEIVERVRGAAGFNSLESHVSARRPFDLDGDIADGSRFHQSIDDVSNPIQCYARRRNVGYVSRDDVHVNHDWIDKWKVMTAYSNNIGTELNDDNQNAFVAEPGSVCTETFIVIGAGLELNRDTAGHLVVYLKSKFARFLHAMAKVSQHATRRTYQFVPLVDLTDGSGIDWSASSERIDEQLFDLYELTDDERTHISSSIKPMQ